MNVTTTLLASLALAAPVTTAGCGGAPAAPDSPVPAGPDLAGRWQSGCVDPGSSQALRLTFELTPTTWTLAYESFGDAACTTPALLVRIAGPYDVTGPSPTVAGAHEGRFGFTTKTVTPLSQGAADFLPQACGGGTFTVGTATDISAGCAGLGAYPIANCPADYDLVARSGDELRFGARPTDNNMCTETQRPTALSPMILNRI